MAQTGDEAARAELRRRREPLPGAVTGRMTAEEMTHQQRVLEAMDLEPAELVRRAGTGDRTALEALRRLEAGLTPEQRAVLEREQRERRRPEAAPEELLAAAQAGDEAARAELRRRGLIPRDAEAKVVGGGAAPEIGLGAGAPILKFLIILLVIGAVLGIIASIF